MKNLKFAILSIFIIGAFGTSFAQKVETDSDKEADFSNYTTVSFLGWQENVDQVLSEFDQKRFIEAFKEEFEKRNLTLVESDGDIAVVLYVVVEQITSTTAYTSYYYGGAGRGYGRGGRGGWGRGYASTEYSETDYLQGTLVIDVFDGLSKEQIWQAVGSKTVKENSKKRDKTIPKGVKKIMKKFPIAPLK